MSPQNRRQISTTAALLTRNPVLAFPSSVSTYAVEQCARLWSPAATSLAGGGLAVTESLELRGPVDHDETLWRAANLPLDSTAVYVVVSQTGLPLIVDPVGLGLVSGLSARLGGQWRLLGELPIPGPLTRLLGGFIASRRGFPKMDWRAYRDSNVAWHEPGSEMPSSPTVWAPRELTAEDLLELLEPSLPGLKPGVPEDQAAAYTLVAPGLVVELVQTTVFPRVRMQPWFVADDDTFEYLFFVEDDFVSDAGIQQQVAAAAEVLAAATGGVVLEGSGFPWEQPA